ncbi:MAG: site-specific DNA-methyltransferase [Patescibacteria group bacterium]
MPRPKKAKEVTTAAPVVSYKHTEKRKRIPTQEESIRIPAKDKRPARKKYAYDPSLDPQLVWAGKEEEGSAFTVPTVPIYVQEKIAPEAIIARIKAGADDSAQMMLFGETAHEQAGKAVEFYQHEENWQNRMILGDSLVVMNSLLEKEGLRGRVQTIYIDPPYGIKFGSNWQVSTRKRDVKDNKVDDFVRQPEQVKAFRDTWKLGIHSYLSYLRDRLTVARELLTESGSCFVQINDENLHLIRSLIDEIFRSSNIVCIIPFIKTSSATSNWLSTVNDYIVWVAKDVDSVKYRQLYESRSDSTLASAYTWAESAGIGVRKLSKNEIEFPGSLPDGCRRFMTSSLFSQSGGENSYFEFEYEGEKYKPPSSSFWKTNRQGLEHLAKKGRLLGVGKTLTYRRFADDFPVVALNNFWTDTIQSTFAVKKIYVVETAAKVIQRCLLMTSDPGDIVLDPTCGSGTSAYVAEQWGRRWITIDTSRVALALARTRLMTAKYPYYKLKEDGNVRMGFECKTVPHVTLKSLANDEESPREVLHDQPLENKDRVRVSGPFTVESLSPHRVSDAQEMVSTERFVETIIENLRKAGVQTGDKGARVEFVNLDILPSGPEVQAVGEYKTDGGLKKVAVAIGPEFGSVDDDFVLDAANVAKKFANLLVVAGTAFEASAFNVPKEIEGLRIMRVKINPDLSMGDLLKKTGSGNLFLAFGEPEVKVQNTKDGIIVEIVGVDVYDPVKSEIRSSGSGDPEHDIAAWFIDANYNGDAFFVTHAYFLGADQPYEKLKRALKADIPEDAWACLYTTTSCPIPKPQTGKIAVKVINHYGDEVMKVVEIE